MNFFNAKISKTIGIKYDKILFNDFFQIVRYKFAMDL